LSKKYTLDERTLWGRCWWGVWRKKIA